MKKKSSNNSKRKLPGKYKGNRKHQPAPEIVRIECGACGWRSAADRPLIVEAEYLCHIEKVHYTLLECAYCQSNLSHGIRTHGTYEALAAHIKAFHPEIAPKEVGALPPHSFK